MIAIKNVSFGYKEDEWILKHINMCIRKGECVLLCGRSGCGKTTITKLINGLIPHFAEQGVIEGEVMIDTAKVSETPMYELARKVGSVFQNPKSQFFNLDTESEMAFGLENEGMPTEMIKTRLEETIHRLGIKKLRRRNIFSLSGGEKQSLAFASVYAMQPKVYVLDEPTANLDEAAIDRLAWQLKQLKQEGCSIIIAEHRLYFLKDLIDRAYYIDQGSIQEEYTSADFLALSDQERMKLGLRTINQQAVTIAKAIRSPDINGLYIEHLSCGYKKKKSIIKDLSFCAKKGEVLAITGQNGIGKTTLIRCLCGLIKQEEGSIFLQGQALSAKERRKACFLVMQDVNHQLFSDSVWAECEEATVNVNTKKIEETLKSFDLLQLKDRHPMTLSGGQKQRLTVVLASLSEKEVIFFDEPTSGLDYSQMMQVTYVVRKLADTGHIVIVITHDKEFQQSACDRILNL